MRGHLKLSVVLATAIACALSACHAAQPDADGIDMDRNGRAGEPPRVEAAIEAPLRLAPTHEWQRMNPPDTFMVSPRWSTGGEWVLMSGRMGTGLFARSVATGDYAVVDDAYRGPAKWLRGRNVVCLTTDASGRARIFDASRRALVNDEDGACVERPWDDALGAQVHREASATWFHHPKEGSVSVRRDDGRVDTMVAAEAWGVSVAPNGRRVAYSTGVLEDPTLFVLDLEAGETRVLGRGAYPAWMPNGRLLIFTSPGELVPSGEGKATFDSAELLVYHASTDELRLLTETPDVAEMEPAVTADGTTLAFSDWRDGTVYVAELRAGGER